MLMAILHSMVNVPMTTPLKKTDFPSASSHQLPIVPQLEWELMEPLPIRGVLKQVFVATAAVSSRVLQP